eukprot:TRINITY_DN46333_c0_g1_i1.p1 TRINITY_DN46333_c0_g1~~TRINITY_DN46333_c0_g1_i1.p1  ORF type:complete len:382 (+),score=29.80 TRINITY_DN46333_c0_g1_i1:48-1193(+)
MLPRLLASSLLFLATCEADRLINSSKHCCAKDTTGNYHVLKCVFFPMATYVNLGDGGCFQHLNYDGSFINGGEDTYRSKFCPFAGQENKARRELLMWWFLRAIANASAVPFAVSDLAKSCLLGNVESLPTVYPRSNETTPKEYCETMLSLPLMFESIGFRSVGLTMEDARAVSTGSYKGRITSRSAIRRVGPNDKCEPLIVTRHARLALRAVLPTYFLHVYAQSEQGLNEKVRRSQNEQKRFKKQHWRRLAETVCKAADSPKHLDALFSLDTLRSRNVVSTAVAVLERDKGTCRTAEACNYDADQNNHVGACDQCKAKAQTYPYFCEKAGLCSAEDVPDFGCKTFKCTFHFKRSCTCYKAIGLYFTKDLKEALAAAEEACT